VLVKSQAQAERSWDEAFRFLDDAGEVQHKHGAVPIRRARAKEPQRGAGKRCRVRCVETRKNK